MNFVGLQVQQRLQYQSYRLRVRLSLIMTRNLGACSAMGAETSAHVGIVE